jgi:hypothetical protein
MIDYKGYLVCHANYPVVLCFLLETTGTDDDTNFPFGPAAALLGCTNSAFFAAILRLRNALRSFI